MLWRETNSSPTGNAGWTADSAWSLVSSSGSKTRYNNVLSIAYSTSGLPANTVKITLTVRVFEGSQSYTLALQQTVYLSNHN